MKKKNLMFQYDLLEKFFGTIKFFIKGVCVKFAHIDGNFILYILTITAIPYLSWLNNFVYYFFK